jgi:glycerophosphoryl diester phosphodiesterase
MQPFYLIGHRGAAGEKFENSMSGFEHALNLGIDAIELDIRIHQGELWVIHDRALERLTGSPGRFDELEDPTTLRLLNGEPIPRLTEVLDLYWGKLPVNIEIKSPDTGPVLLELLKQYPAETQESEFPWILISSFDHRQLLDLRQRGCHWPLAPITTLGESALVNPLIKQINPYSFHMDNEYLDFDLAREIQQQGVRVMIFTVNQPERMIELKQAGIDGIFTDFPSTIASSV